MTTLDEIADGVWVWLQPGGETGVSNAGVIADDDGLTLAEGETLDDGETEADGELPPEASLKLAIAPLLATLFPEVAVAVHTTAPSTRTDRRKYALGTLGSSSRRTVASSPSP